MEQKIVCTILQLLINIYKGNLQCNVVGSQPGAGGYSSGVLNIPFPVKMYVVVGGKGIYGTGPQLQDTTAADDLMTDIMELEAAAELLTLGS